MSVVSHYTSFDCALLILTSGKVKFSCMLNSNDRNEIEYCKKHPESQHYYFCVSHKEMDSLMWFSYSKDRRGACIEFILKKKKRINTLIKSEKYTIEKGNISYIGNPNKRKTKKKDNKIKAGFIKDWIFKREQEYRFLISTKKEPNTEKETNPMIDINFDIVEKINLYVTNFFDVKVLQKIFDSYDVLKNLVEVKIEERL